MAPFLSSFFRRRVKPIRADTKGVEGSSSTVLTQPLASKVLNRNLDRTTPTHLIVTVIVGHSQLCEFVRELISRLR